MRILTCLWLAAAIFLQLGCSKKDANGSEKGGGGISLVSKDRQITYQCSVKNYPGSLTEPGGPDVFYMKDDAVCKAGYEQPQAGSLEQPNPNRRNLVEVPVDKRTDFKITSRLVLAKSGGTDPAVKYDFSEGWNVFALPLGDSKSCHTLEMGLTYKDPESAKSGKNKEARLVWTRKTNPNGSLSWSPADQTDMPTSEQFQISNLIDAKVFLHCGWKNKNGEGVLGNQPIPFQEPEWHNITYRCRHANYWANFTAPGEEVVIYNTGNSNKVECEAGYTAPSSSAIVQETAIKDAKIEIAEGVSTSFIMQFVFADMVKRTTLANPAWKYNIVGDQFFREPALPFGRFANCHTLEYQAFAKDAVGAADKQELRISWRRAMNNGRLTWLALDQNSYPIPAKVQNAKEPFSMYHMQCNWIRADKRALQVIAPQ